MNDTTYTNAEQDALDHLARMARDNLAALTGRSITKRTMERLAARGLARDAGMCCVTDDDGRAKEPEQWRQGWELTPEGKIEVARIKAAPKLLSGYLAP